MGSFDSFSAAISGLQSQSFALQNISGNIANAQTTGFKTTDTRFLDVLNAQSPSNTASGGVQAISTETDTTQGAIQNSDISSFMAVKGDGFFSVERPSSVDSSGTPSFAGTSAAYSRRGDFQLDGNGYLVNGAGDYLMGNTVDPTTGVAGTGTAELLKFDSGSLPATNGPLQNVSIGPNDVIQGIFADGKIVDLASVPLSSFRGEEFLRQGDGATFTPTAQSGAAQTNAPGQIVGSALEASNADVTDQFTVMIQTQQAYSANTKVVTISNEMLQTLTNMTI